MDLPPKNGHWPGFLIIEGGFTIVPGSEFFNYGGFRKTRLTLRVKSEGLKQALMRQEALAH